MPALSIGDTAPDVTMPRDGGEDISLSDFKGHYLILYFYPKDDTPGCTTEAIGFSAHAKSLKVKNIHILGVSKDKVAKHDKFVAKHDLTIPLGSDAEGDMIERYGVWVEKSMYGKTYMGIERSTFLIDPNGKILEIWRKVRVKGHVDAVVDAAIEAAA
ncbi:thioredoxin-dependent thiol peroxidase [Fretibacter rubidus]|uniref:thioredoxin-dependent thiol peroxidase n=1 Tax=Fretibacter rubidus TaxID=570162 RepID=UPI00352ABC66